MTSPEKKFSKSNNWKTRTSKIKTLGGASALSLMITLSSCGDKDLEVKQSAEKYQNKVEEVEKAKKTLKEKKEALKEAQEEVQEAEKNLIEEQKEAEEAKKEIKDESNKL